MAYPTIDALIHVCHEYERISGLSRASIGRYVFGSARRLDEFDAGADVSTRTFCRAMQWFSDHWPVDKAWPQAIERPSPTPRAPDAVPSRKRRAARADNHGGAQ
jgi:hypothetical protein